MNFIREIWQKYLKRAPEFIGVISKIGLLAGGACIVIYSLTIGHYPKELSLGDGLLFLITAFVAGGFALIFIGSLLCLGIVLSPITRGIFNTIAFLNNKFSKKKLNMQYSLMSFDWLALIGSAYSIIIMGLLAQKNAQVLFTFPLLSILVYIFASLFLSGGKKIREIQCQKIEFLPNNNINQPKEKKLHQLRQMQRVSAFSILILPLLLGGVTPQLLQGTMRMIHIRTESATVFVAEPYATILANPLATELPNESKIWKRFDSVTILSSGYGKFTVISKGSGEGTIKLEVPNEKIVVK